MNSGMGAQEQLPTPNFIKCPVCMPFYFQDGIKDARDKNSHQTRDQDGRSLRPESFAAAVNTPPRVSATYVKSSINGRTISSSREVTV